MILVRPHGLHSIPTVSTPAFTASQLRTESLLQGFARGATHWQSLSAMMLGGLAYRLARGFALPLLSSAWIPAPASRLASAAFGLGVEVGIYEGAQRSLSLLSGEGEASRLFAWEGASGLREGLLHSLVSFGVLKATNGLGPASHPVLREISQDLGMILSHRATEAAGLSAHSSRSLAEEFIEAAVVNLQMRAGMSLGGLAMGGRLQALESAAERASQARVRDARGAEAELLPRMSLGEEGDAGLNLNPKWNLRDYQSGMIGNLRRDIRARISSWLGLVSPMQTGKSYLEGPAIEMMRQELGANTRFIILSSSKVTTLQILADLFTCFDYNEIGRFDSDVKQTDKLITVASVYSLANHLDLFALKPSEKVVIVNDEAYFTQAPIYRAIYEHFGVGEVQEMEGRQTLGPSENPRGWVLGVSGTGAGLEGYHVSGQLGLMEAIEGGWIRHMRGERILLKRKPPASERPAPSEDAEEARTTISTEELIEDEEQMIWWEPTIENARKLREIYHKKIYQARFEKPLIFVPTIQHGELMMKALREFYGPDFAYFVHSKKRGAKEVTDAEVEREERDIDVVLERWKADAFKQQPLVSVRQISRGFRGKGTGAVFHTYQTNSMELFSQRTGRAWGTEPGENLPELYVLEVAWSQKIEFANLARVLGLLDYPRLEFRSRGLKETLGKIERTRKLRSEMEAQVDLGAVDDLFLSIPILESWRAQYDQIVRQAGGINELARRTGIRMETLAGFALGALPTQRWQVAALSPYLGGEAKAVELWTRVWRDVVDEWFAGGQSLEGEMTADLNRWVTAEHASPSAQADALHEILTRHFHAESKQRGPIRRGVYRLMAQIRAMYPTQLSDQELSDAILEERKAFEEDLREDSLDAALFAERLMRRKVPPLQEIAERFETSTSLVSTRERYLLRRFAAAFVKARCLAGGGNLHEASVEYLTGSPGLLSLFRRWECRRIGDLMARSPKTHLASEELSAALRNQLHLALREKGACIGSDLRPSEAALQALDERVDFGPYFTGREWATLERIFREQDIQYLGDLARLPVGAFEGLEDSGYLKLLGRMANSSLALGMNFEWVRPGDRKPVPAAASEPLLLDRQISPPVPLLLGRSGIRFVGDVARLSLGDLKGLGLDAGGIEELRFALARRNLSLGLKLEAWRRPGPRRLDGSQEDKVIADLPYLDTVVSHYMRRYLRCCRLRDLASYTEEGLLERGVPPPVVQAMFELLHRHGYEFGMEGAVRRPPIDIDEAISLSGFESWRQKTTPLDALFDFYGVRTWRDLLAWSEEDLQKRLPRVAHREQVRGLLAMRGLMVGMKMADYPAPRGQLLPILLRMPIPDQGDRPGLRLFDDREEAALRRSGCAFIADLFVRARGKAPLKKMTALIMAEPRLHEMGLWYEGTQVEDSWSAPPPEDLSLMPPAAMTTPEFLALPLARLQALVGSAFSFPEEAEGERLGNLRDVLRHYPYIRERHPQLCWLLEIGLRDLGCSIDALRS